MLTYCRHSFPALDMPMARGLRLSPIYGDEALRTSNLARAAEDVPVPLIIRATGSSDLLPTAAGRCSCDGDGLDRMSPTQKALWNGQVASLFAKSDQI
jgi:hypothetical protein